jgi:hypothetical protein
MPALRAVALLLPTNANAAQQILEPRVGAQ